MTETPDPIHALVPAEPGLRGWRMDPDALEWTETRIVAWGVRYAPASRGPGATAHARMTPIPDRSGYLSTLPGDRLGEIMIWPTAGDRWTDGFDDYASAEEAKATMVERVVHGFV